MRSFSLLLAALLSTSLPAADPIPRAEPVAAPAARTAPAVAFDPGERLVAAIRGIASSGVPYAGTWVAPSGERLSMDCSNTARWLLQETQGLQVPRTASSQYEFFRKQGKLRRVSSSPAKLRRILRPGDVLFWEHTYRPRRKPPVTHVMIYAGTTPDGTMQMVGSQGSRGPNVYSFRPDRRMGGYRWFLGLLKRSGRFVAFARPM